MSTRILFYVQHLMGVGHVFRAMRIVRALTAAGHHVDLVYGGEPVPNFDPGGAKVHFLPPLRAGTETFNALEDASGNVVTEAYKSHRRDLLLDLFETGGHDAIITEAFPFGRRQMRFELDPLLQAAKNRKLPPVIIASVRDILQENRKPGRDLETVATLKTHFGHVLVHGDPNMVSLAATFPLFDEIAQMVRYTGIVAPPAPERTGARGEFDVVVSVGGGALGRDLLFAAIKAKPISCLADSRWCIVTGINFAADDYRQLESMVGSEIALRRFLPDLCKTLAGARLSVSRCGYNTAADIFSSGCRAVVVPLSNGTETEQIRRAEIMHQKGLAVRLDPELQTPEHVASAIDEAMANKKRDRMRLDLSGAETMARMVTEILADRR